MTTVGGITFTTVAAAKADLSPEFCVHDHQVIRTTAPLRLAIAVDAKHAQHEARQAPFADLRLAARLTAMGHQVEILSWEAPHPALTAFDAIHVSSTWNACRAPSAFRAWLERCEQDGRARLINHRRVLETGFVKHRYWQLLASMLEHDPTLRAHGALTPTQFFIDADEARGGLEALAGRTLAQVIEANAHLQQVNVVLKPTISADGINTFVYDRFGTVAAPRDPSAENHRIVDATHAERIFATLARNLEMGGVMVQPYMPGVEHGEYSLTVIGGVCTHAVQKGGSFGGGDHRAFVPLDALPRHLVAFAEGLVSQVDNHFGTGSVSRARVDLFAQTHSVPMLCEFECVEPNTNLSVVQRDAPALLPEIVTRYAEAIAQRAVVLRG